METEARLHSPEHTVSWRRQLVKHKSPNPKPYYPLSLSLVRHLQTLSGVPLNEGFRRNTPPSTNQHPASPISFHPIPSILLSKPRRHTGATISSSPSHRIRHSQVLDGVASDEALGHAPEPVAILGRADHLSQVNVHPRVTRCEVAVVCLAILQLY